MSLSLLGKCLKKFIPNFLPRKLMSDAAAAIFNGFSKVYPAILPGKCYFHMIKIFKDRHYDDKLLKMDFLNDLRSLSNSYSLLHFEISEKLFLEKYENHQNETIKDAAKHLLTVWLTEHNKGWHSGLCPGTVTTNNGLESTNCKFKRNFKGKRTSYSV